MCINHVLSLSLHFSFCHLKGGVKCDLLCRINVFKINVVRKKYETNERVNVGNTTIRIKKHKR